jgi:hypothetical protein
LAADDLGQLAIAVGLTGIPTLAVSVLAGGAADRELLSAALDTMDKKLRLGHRGQHRKGVAQ